MATRAEIIAARFIKIAEVTWRQLECRGTTSLFTLFRKGAGTLNDLGIPAFAWDKVATDRVAIFFGLDLNDLRFTVTKEGQQQMERVEFWTSTEVLEGDQIYLTHDSKMYVCEGSLFVGPLYRCQLNAGKGQFTGISVRRCSARARIA